MKNNFSLNWDEFKKQLNVGDIIEVQVTRYAHFGFFVLIHGSSFEGLIQVTDIKDKGSVTEKDYPKIGSLITSRVLGFQDSGQKVWLGIKPSQLRNIDVRLKH